jgi:hypothetical protein
LKAEAFAWRCYTLLSVITIIVSLFIVYKLATTFEWDLVVPMNEIYRKIGIHGTQAINQLAEWKSRLLASRT